MDDTAFATHSGGALIATDSTANSVDLITGTLTRGMACTASPWATPTPPRPTRPPGAINLNPGLITAVTGPNLTPHSLIYIPDTHPLARRRQKE